MLSRLFKALLYLGLFIVCMPFVIIVGAVLLSIFPEESTLLYTIGMGVCTATAFGLPKLLADLIIKCWNRRQEGIPEKKDGVTESTSIIRRESLPVKKTSAYKEQTDVCESYSSNMMQRTGWWKCDQCGRENASYTSSCACGNPKRRAK